MAKKTFDSPKKRAALADPDSVNIGSLSGSISTDHLRKKDENVGNADYKKQFTQVRIQRPIAEEFRKYADERNIKHYGNYINAVLQAYLDGDLQTTEK